ncbi:MAG: aminotransferase class V-fold PLP-dependent enzyme [Acidobacteria bacterium]|nr:aminotransferase class V-fold PLP-dependent enzyme [Acidobacteriota bacterium]
MAEKKGWSRRDVIKGTGMLSAAMMTGIDAAAAPTKSAKAASPGALKAGQILTGHEVPFTDGDFADNLFTRIGIRPLINCRGTITAISGSTSLPEVKQAMYNASLYHVRMDEMMDAVGAELGKLAGAEWGVATTGACTSICLSTVACIAGTDVEKSQAMPYIKKKDQVVIPKTSRNPYDIGVRMCGVEVVEFSSPEELREKIGERTAMMYILANPRWDNTPMSTKNLAAIAKEHGVPVFVDAAATELDLPNPHIEAGADLVAYSGGKCMRGPQSSGLLIGRKDLCQAVYFQGAPHHNYGRAMKCSKEEMMGLLAAVRAWRKRDHEAEQAMWTGWCQSIADRMQGLPSVKATVLPSAPKGSIDRSPGVRISWDASVTGITGSEMAKLLDEGTPRIVLGGTGSRPDHMLSAVTIYCYIMTPAEVKIVADTIYKHLKNPPHFENPVVPSGTPASVAGDWEVTVHYVRGTGEQHFVLKQDGNSLTGEHHGEIYNTTIAGAVHGNEIALTSTLPVTGYPLTCRFKGTVEGNRMSGTVNLAEYGEVKWDAIRA